MFVCLCVSVCEAPVGLPTQSLMQSLHQSAVCLSQDSQTSDDDGVIGPKTHITMIDIQLYIAIPAILSFTKPAGTGKSEFHEKTGPLRPLSANT